MLGFKEYTVLRLAQQIIGRLKVLVDHSIVHGDIQPGNFLLGKDVHSNRTVFLIDFGLSSTVSTANSDVTSITTNTNEYNEGNSINNSVHSFNSHLNTPTTTTTQNIQSNQISKVISSKFGTLQFASASTLQGLGSPVFRDDLESCAYTLSYLLLGHLPWTHQDMALYTLDHDKSLISSNPSEYSTRRQHIIQSVIDMKKRVTVSDLCESFANTGIGEVINNLLVQSKQLQSAEKPDYDFVLSMIDKLLLEAKLSNTAEDGLYDWEAMGMLWSTTDGSTMKTE